MSTNKKKISITRALRELKEYDKKIGKASEAPFITYKVAKKEKLSDINPAASLQKVRDLIEARQQVKNAIQRANATTDVKIGKETMTIAQAIDRKHNMHLYESLLANLREQNRIANAMVTRYNEAMETSLNRQLEQINGSSNKTDPSSSTKYAELYRESNGAELVDELNIADQIELLYSFINDFMSEVDLSLSEVNSLTTIEVNDI